MKRTLAFLLFLCFLIPAHAESTSSIIDYVKGQGFQITETWESPGWRTCYLLENPDSQTLTFSDMENAYAIVAGPQITIPFRESELRDLFVDLISSFDWDVSFFNPDQDADDTFVLSYGITKDLDRTKENYSDQSEYLAALESWLESDKEAAWQSLYDKIDSWNAPEIEASSITDCVTEIIGTRPLSSKTTNGTLPACAQYIIFPGYVFAGPGGEKPTLAKFLHPDLGTWSFEEQWGIYGNMVQYIRDHSADLLADGLRTSSGSVNNTVSISLYTEPCQYISFFNLVTGEISTSILDN